MDKDNKNRNIDNDIAQSRKDVLRASDIIPSKEKKNSSHSPRKQTKNYTSEIPSFDLSRHPTSHQRQKASNSRKPPSRNRVSEKENPTKSRKQIGMDLHKVSFDVPEQKLITEIVARDIAKWYNQ